MKFPTFPAFKSQSTLLSGLLIFFALLIVVHYFSSYKEGARSKNVAVTGAKANASSKSGSKSGAMSTGLIILTVFATIIGAVVFVFIMSQQQ